MCLPTGAMVTEALHPKHVRSGPTYSIPPYINSQYLLKYEELVI